VAADADALRCCCEKLATWLPQVHKESLEIEQLGSDDTDQHADLALNRIQSYLLSPWMGLTTG
jgi:hypothetical protein